MRRLRQAVILLVAVFLAACAAPGASVKPPHPGTAPCAGCTLHFRSQSDLPVRVVASSSAGSHPFVVAQGGRLYGDPWVDGNAWQIPPRVVCVYHPWGDVSRTFYNVSTTTPVTLGWTYDLTVDACRAF